MGNPPVLKAGQMSLSLSLIHIWWTKPGLPKQTTRVRTLPAGKEAGIAELKNVYVTRFLTAENLKKGDSCTSLVEALDGNGNPAGDGMALYTFCLLYTSSVKFTTPSAAASSAARERNSLRRRTCRTATGISTPSGG